MVLRPKQLVLIVVGAWSVLLAGIYALGWEERKFAANLEDVQPGMSRETVFQLLGRPQFEGTDCYIAQFIKFEKPQPRPAAKHCAHWIGPSAFFQFYAVGFGTDDRVVWVAYGDS